MASKTVLSVGQCRPDNAAISHFLSSHFDVQMLFADSEEAALQQLRDQDVDLVLINRKLDADGSDGLEIIQGIKSDSVLAETPVMLISNYEEWQQRAQELGAVAGFGKAELRSETARERVAAVLSF